MRQSNQSNNRAAFGKKTFLIAAAAASVVGLHRAAYAANDTWSAAAPGASFWNAANWVSGGVAVTPVPGDSLFFGASTVTSLNDNFAAGTSFAGATFNSGASPFTIGGNSVTFGSAVTVNSGGGILQTINNPFIAASLQMGSNASTGNALSLGASDAVGAFSVLSTTAATANSLSIAANTTLTDTGNFTVGTLLISGGASTQTALNITGAGTLNVTAATNSNFVVSVPGNNNPTLINTATLSMDGLSNFVYVGGTGSMEVGVGTRSIGILTLANTSNSIGCAEIDVADTLNQNNGGASTLNFGRGSNLIQTNTILIGTGKSSGDVQFLSTTAGSVTILGEGGGTSTTDITLGTATAATNAAGLSSLFLAGHNAVVQGGTVQVGRLAGSTAGSAAAGAITFDTGTFSVGSLQLANNVSGSNGAGAQGSFTLGTDNNSTGVLNVNTQFLLVDRTSAGTTPAIGTFTMNGGTANIASDILVVDSANSTTNRNATFNLNGGTLNMMGHAIGSAALPITNMNFPNASQTAQLLNLGGGGIFTANGNGTAVNTNGGLTMTGTGTLILNGPSNTYTGDTTVLSGNLVVASSLPSTSNASINGGALIVTGSTPSTANVNVNTGGILSGNGNGTTTGVTGMVILNSGGEIKPGSSSADGSVGTLTMNNLTVNGGDMRFDLSSTPGASDRITVLGAANFTAASTITPIFPLAAHSGSFTLLTAASLTGTAPTVNTPSNNTRTQYAVHFGDVVPNALTLSVLGQAANLTWVGSVDAGGGTFVWDVKNTQNWTSNAPSDPNRFYDLDIATFDDSAAHRTVTINSTVSPSAVFVNNSASHDYVFSGSGAIGGPAILTKSGAGVATILTNNTYVGTTTVNGGTLFIAANQSTTGATVVNGGTMIVDATLVSQQPTTINGGQLIVGNGDAAGALGSGTITVNNPGTVVFNRSDTTTIGNVINGSGSVSKNGSSTMTLTNTNTYTGTTNVNAGTVVVTNASASGSSLGAITGGPVNLPVGSTMAFGGLQTGTGAFNFGFKQFNVAGSGSGAGVIVNDGTTQFNAFRNINLTGDATFGGSQRFDMRAVPTTSLGGTLTLNNNTLHINGNGLTFGLVGIAVSTGTIEVDQGTLSFETGTQALADPNSAIVFEPNTTWQLFQNIGTLSQTRQVIINGDNVSVGQTSSSAAAATSVPILLKGNLNIHSFGSPNTGALLLLGNISQDSTPRQVIKNDPAPLTLGGSNSFTGGLNIQQGLVQFANANALAPGNSLQVNGGSTLQLNGNSVSVSDLSGGGFIENDNPAAATVTMNNANDDQLDGTIQDGAGGGSVSFVKNGAGRFTLSGSNNFTGPATINAGTVTLGGSGTISPAVAISGTSNGTFEINRGDPLSFTNSLSGGINFSKSGSNVVVMPATYTYTGTTAIQSGTLVVNGALLSAGTVNVNDGATLAGAGSVGKVSMTGNSHVLPGSTGADGSVGTLTMNSLAVNSGELRFDLGTSSDRITINNAAIFNGGSISVAGNPSAGTYTVLTAGALTLNTTPSVVQPNDPNQRPATYALDTATANTLKLVVTGGPLSLIWNGGNNSNAWDVNTTKNWNPGNTDFFFNQDVANFTDASGNRTVNINNGDVSPGAVVFSHSTGSYTINGSNGIAGAAGVTINGGGTVVINTNNNYTGTTAVQNGTLVLGSSNAIPNSQSTNVVLGNGATNGVIDLAGFDLNVASLSTSGTGAGNIIASSSTSNSPHVNFNGGSSTFGGIIQDSINGGTQPVNVSVNSGTLILTGNNTYTGQTQVNGNSVLQIGAGGNTGSFGNSSVHVDGALIFNRSDTLVLTQTVSGLGSIIINAGTVQVGNGGTSGTLDDGPIVNNAALVFNRSDDQTINGVISGSGSLTKNGSNTLTLNAPNTYTGTTNVNTGTVVVTTTSATGSSLGSITGGPVNLPVGSTMAFGGLQTGTGAFNFGFKQFNVAGTGSGEGVIVNDGTTQFNAFRNINLTGDATFGGSQRFDMRAVPTTSLGGTLTLNNNTLHINGNGLTFGLVGIAVSTGTIEVDQGTLSFETDTQALADSSSAIVFEPNTTWQFFQNTGTLSQTRQVIINGDNISVGQTTSAVASATSTPILLKGDLNVHAFGSPTTGTLLLLGNITQDSTPRQVIKNDNSPLVLGGSNSYTGGTTLQAGTLITNTNFSNGTLTINAGLARVAAKAANADPTGVTIIPSLSINDGSLDLTNNAMVVDYAAGNSPFSTVRTQITAGYASGSWNGNGINSSSAATAINTAHPTALGYAEASALGLSSFAGHGVDNTSVLVRYTLAGDGNLDGKVNALDFNALASNFGVSSNGNWTQGDFNYDGQVTTVDFTALAQNFNAPLAASVLSAPLGALVPEPALVGAIGMLLLAGRRRRG